MGRTGEKRQLDEARRHGRSIVVTGPIGIGKTRLLDWSARRAADGGWESVTIRASIAISTVPFGALTTLLDDTLSAPTPTDALLGAVARLRQRAATTRGVVLCIDDAPRLDPQSAGLVHQLVVSGIATVFATARLGEDLPDGMRELQGERRLEPITLASLSRAETFRLASQVAHRQLDATQLEQVWVATSGNPLFVTELMIAADGLNPMSPSTIVGPARSGGSVAGVVAARLGRIPEDEMLLLRQLAVCGPLSGVSRLVDPALIGSLERRALVVTEDDGARRMVRLAHPLFGEAALDGTSEDERRHILRAHADRLVGDGARRRDDGLAAAVALERSGHPLPTELALGGAEQANARGAHDLAERLARMAYEAQPSVYAGVLLAWARLHLGAITFAEAVPFCDELVPLARNGDEHALVATTQAIFAMHDLTHLDRAEEIIEGHLRALPDVARLEVLGVAAGSSLYCGDVTSAVAQLDEVLSAPVASPRAIHTALTAASNAMYLHGRTTEAVRRLRTLLDQRDSTATGLPSLRVQLELELAEALAWYGDAVASGAIFDRLRHELPLAVDPSSPGVIVSIVHSLVEALDGRQSAELMEFASRGWHLASPYRPWFTYAFARSAYAAARVGDTATADHLLQRVAETETSYSLHLVTVARTRAELALQSGLPDNSGLGFDAARQDAERLGNRAEALLAAVRAAAVAPSPKRSAAARRLADQFDGLLASRLAGALDSFARRDPAEAATHVHAIGACGHTLVALDLDALGAAAFGPSWTRVTRPDPSAPPADVIDLRTGAPSRLTRREHEVACLVIPGMTNAEIADELGISVRTVHAHVRSLFNKLGVNDRRDVAIVLRTAEPEH